VDRLVAAGLVERQPCAGDRRVVYAALSARGREVASAALERHAASLRTHVLDVIGAEQLDALGRAMRALRDHHREETAGSEPS
jgi:DNA-binding MarR family transcriptional regulator